MTDLRLAAKQALEALGLAKLNGKSGLHPAEIEEIAGAITALKAALAEPVEPVAWIHTDPDKRRVKFLEWRENEPGYRGDWIKTPLYTAPPK